MGYLENTTESRKGKHLTYLERLRIEYLFKEHLKPREIAVRLERNRRTIEREIAKEWLSLKDQLKPGGNIVLI